MAKKPPPRQWLLGNSFCRTFLSSITAAGGGAKTSVQVAQHLAMATGLPLTGEKVHQRCRVLLVSLEDDIDELNRRITAAMIHHKIDPEEARGYLFVCAPKGLRLMIMGEGGQPVRAQLYHELRRWVVAKNIDVVSLDPFVKTHSLPENDNSALDKVAELLAELAIEFKIAVDCPHHVH